jgi:hypothetical protein
VKIIMLKNSTIYRGLLFLAATSIAPVFSSAQEPAKTPPSPTAPPPIVRISDTVMKVGEVTLDKSTKTISFPGAINLDRGEMEYLIVQEGGKTHESLLVTKALPFHIHIAMLLLGAKIPPQPDMAPPPDAIDLKYLKTAPKLKGPDVMIFVRWVQDGKTVAMHAEDMMFDEAAKKQMSRGPWTYNGSMVNQGVFLAQEDRSIAALVTDPSALINNERPDSDNDQVWSILAEKTPKAGTPVEISIQLLNNGAEADPQASPPPSPK